MSSSQLSSAAATDASGLERIATRFEVTTLPVADVDRAKAFYQRLGWRLDIDFKPTPDTRGVQFTPPGSPASIQFGEGTTTMAARSLQGLLLVVDDIEAARDDLVSRGVDVSEIWHNRARQGPDRRASTRTRRSYASLAIVRGPRRQRLAPAGDHRAAPGPGVTDGRRAIAAAPARDGRASWLVRGGRPAARLVGLVRGVLRRPAGRKRRRRRPTRPPVATWRTSSTSS